MSEEKNTVVERLKECVANGVTVDDCDIIDAIVELAKRMDEMEKINKINLQLKERRQYIKGLVSDVDYNIPPAKPEPDAKWPEIVISQMATANFHSLSIRVKGEWPITIATFNSQYLKYFEAMVASYHKRFEIVKVTSEEYIQKMLNAHGHDQEDGE